MPFRVEEGQRLLALCFGSAFILSVRWVCCV